jgi:hypothetical protein
MYLSRGGSGQLPYPNTGYTVYMIALLIELSLATLGAWDILRRLLPTRVHAVIGKIICVVIPYSLYRWGLAE